MTEKNPLEESRKVSEEFEQYLQQEENEINCNNKWSESLETLLKSWSERASGYRWMHEKCSNVHKRADVVFTLPQIILSSLAGSANLGLSSVVPEEQQTTANIIVGIVGIGVGILGAISQYLRHSALAEAHRASAFNWGRMSRAIATELSLPPEERTSPSIHFLRDQQAVFDQNIENSPPILNKVIEEFKTKFCNENNRSYFYDISKPEIASGLQPVMIHGREERKRAKALTDAASIMLHKEPSISNKETEQGKKPNKLRRASFGLIGKINQEKKDEPIKTKDNSEIKIDIKDVHEI